MHTVSNDVKFVIVSQLGSAIEQAMKRRNQPILKILLDALGGFVSLSMCGTSPHLLNLPRVNVWYFTTSTGDMALQTTQYSTCNVARKGYAYSFITSRLC